MPPARKPAAPPRGTHPALRGRKEAGGAWWRRWALGAGAAALFAAAWKLFAPAPSVGGAQVGGQREPEGAGAHTPETVATSREYQALVRTKVAMRLTEITRLVERLQRGEIPQAVADAIEEDILEAEKQIATLPGGDARDLRAVASVIRGTLRQKVENLTDAQVEEAGYGFTYANPRYWQDYYLKTTADERFDWYVSWDSAIVEHEFTPIGGGQESRRASSLGDLLRPYMAGKSILMLGSGNADMSEKMYLEGFEDITNVDISQEVLENMRAKVGPSTPRMKWIHGNISALSFAADSFDVAIDKATYDALQRNRPLLDASMREVVRVLKPGGIIVSVSAEPGELRCERHLQAVAGCVDCRSYPFVRMEDTKMRQVNRTASGDASFVHICVVP